MYTISQSLTETFPFTVGELVTIHWKHAKIESAEISELYTGFQCGQHVVYAVMCVSKKNPVPFVVCASLLRKIES